MTKSKKVVNITGSSKAAGYPKISKQARIKTANEDLLPKPQLGESLFPSDFLEEICQYARGAESRGEYLFRKDYLTPLIKQHLVMGVDSYREDDMGNIIVQLGENPWDTLHVGHIDSVHADAHDAWQEIEFYEEPIKKGSKDTFQYMRLAPVKKNSVASIKEGFYWKDNKKIPYSYVDYSLPPVLQRCLGADDGCAVAIMLYLIQEKIEGTYVFTRGEERGCVGTHYMIDHEVLDFSRFKRAIEVDRKGTDEIINEMSPGITASTDFAKSLAAALDMGHKPSDRGSITDVGHIAKLVGECVNVAAGYWKQHTSDEYCLPLYLDMLGQKMKDLNWADVTHSRAAGAYTRPKPKRPIYGGGGTGSTYGTGYSYTRQKKNQWGDFVAPGFFDEDTATFEDSHTNEWQMEAWIRCNVKFVSALLCELGLTPREMELAAENGVKEVIIHDPFEELDAEDTDDALIAEIEAMEAEMHLPAVVEEEDAKPVVIGDVVDPNAVDDILGASRHPLDDYPMY